MESDGARGLDSLRDLGVDVRLGEKAISIDPHRRVLTSNGTRNFDSVVVATGASSVPVSVPGWRKPGVHILDSQESYVSLREAIPRTRKVAILGSTLDALFVADRLTDLGLSVSLFAEINALAGAFGAGAWERVLSEAETLGVRIFPSGDESIVGLDKAEAVISDGRIVPCDAVVMTPKTVVRLPSMAASLGEHGGLVVDRFLRTTASRVFAAGDCVEFRSGGGSIPIMRQSTASAGGKVAGANASGASVVFNPVGCLEANLFGVEIASAGLSLRESREARLDAREVSLTRSGSTCWIVFDRARGRVLGLGVAGPDSAGVIGKLVLTVSKGAEIRELVYEETLGSTDISLVADTAREGLKACQGS